MLFFNRFVVPCLIALGLAPVPAWATAVVNTSLNLTSFQILRSSGKLDILSPVTASDFGQALDNKGASDQSHAATSVPAMTVVHQLSGGCGFGIRSWN
jgi:hypothetical protein